MPLSSKKNSDTPAKKGEKKQDETELNTEDIIGESENANQRKSNQKKVTDSDRLAEDIKKLKVYLKKLQYCPREPPRYSDRTEQLAQAKFRYVRETYEKYKRQFPKFKGQMLKEDLDKFDSKNITAEQLKTFMETRAEAEKERIKARRNRFMQFQKTLSIIEAQCRESVMKDIVQKFAQYVAARTIKGDYPKVITEPQQRLCRGLVCNMLMSLGINSNKCNRVDTCLFEGLASVLADIILKTLYQIQIVDPEEFELPSEVPEIKCTQIDCISKRAKRAVQKNARKCEEQIDSELNQFRSGSQGVGKEFNLAAPRCIPHKTEYQLRET